MSIHYLDTTTNPYHYHYDSIDTSCIPWVTNQSNYKWHDSNTIVFFVPGSDEKSVKVSFNEGRGQLTVASTPEIGKSLHEVIDLPYRNLTSSDISCSISKGVLIVKIESNRSSNTFTIPVQKGE